MLNVQTRKPASRLALCLASIDEQRYMIHGASGSALFLFGSANQLKPRLLEEARPRLVEEARPRLLEEAQPRLVEEAPADLLRYFPTAASVVGRPSAEISSVLPSSTWMVLPAAPLVSSFQPASVYT